MIVKVLAKAWESIASASDRPTPDRSSPLPAWDGDPFVSDDDDELFVSWEWDS